MGALPRLIRAPAFNRTPATVEHGSHHGRVGPGGDRRVPDGGQFSGQQVDQTDSLVASQIGHARYMTDSEGPPPNVTNFR